MTTNDGGSGGIFAFGEKGHVVFANVSSALTINGTAYTLEGAITSLAVAIAANPSGAYALANDYDASGDGTYQNSPIPTEYSGSFEGLGNTISNLSINGTGDINDPVGLFAELGSGNQLGGAIENIVLQKISVAGNGFDVGGLVGNNGGTIAGSFASGSVSSNFQQGAPAVGVLVGISAGTITRSGGKGVVASAEPANAGGLVGTNIGAITLSYATCKVSGGNMSALGGMLGWSDAPVSASYAAGKVSGGTGAEVGGLIGENHSTIAQSYSTTKVIHKRDGRRSGHKGGLIGIDYSSAGDNTYDYWDISTSGIRNPKNGAGKPKNDPGITGLSTAQLQSGLPAGFDPKVWAENPKINNGLPYLIVNPPRE